MMYEVRNGENGELVYKTQPDEHPNKDVALARAQTTIRNYQRQYPGVDPKKIVLIPIEE